MIDENLSIGKSRTVSFGLKRRHSSWEFRFSAVVIRRQVLAYVT